MKSRFVIALVAALALLAVPMLASASTAVPGFDGRGDADNNGIPDAGVVVVGKYESIYAYDANGDWYWDLGDGRVQGTVGELADLDEASLTACYYQVHYRGTFENNPFQDTGWISNNINCQGVDHGTFNYLMVHRFDPRFEDNTASQALLGWGTDWEYKALTEIGSGNLIAHMAHP